MKSTTSILTSYCWLDGQFKSKRIGIAMIFNNYWYRGRERLSPRKIVAHCCLVLLVFLCLPTDAYAERYVRVCHPGGVGELRIATVTKDGMGHQVVTAFKPLSRGFFTKCLDIWSYGDIQLAVGRDIGGGRIDYYSLRHMGSGRGLSAMRADDWRCVYAASGEVRSYREDKWVRGTSCPSGAQPALFSLQITGGGRHFSSEPNRWLQLDLSGGLLKFDTRTIAKEASTKGAVVGASDTKVGAAEVVIGTAIIAGALWSIFDSDGFKSAMSNKNSIHIPGIPFSPIVNGVWRERGEEWREWSEVELRNQVKKSISIESVRTIRIPFYSTTSREVVLVEAVQSGRAGAYYIIGVVGKDTKVVLDGNGATIQKANKLLGLSIGNAKEAESYLKFYASSISADDGIFIVLDSNTSYLSKKLIDKIGLQPIKVRGNKKKGWTIFADVIYGDSLSKSEFLVKRNGYVERLNYAFKKNVSYNYRVVMKKGRRYYVSQ